MSNILRTDRFFYNFCSTAGFALGIGIVVCKISLEEGLETGFPQIGVISPQFPEFQGDTGECTLNGCLIEVAVSELWKLK
jgi:hypothetical protein